MSAPQIGVLAVQGAFAEHEEALRRLGCKTRQLRQAADVHRAFDGLVLPGGESTVQVKLLHELGMFDALRGSIVEGMPVLGTCAGLILLAHDVRDGNDHAAPRGFATLPVTVRRNAYGRQLGSFRADAMPELPLARLATGEARLDAPLPMRFIRAPRIEAVGDGVEALVRYGDAPAAVRFGNQIGCAFHPELTADARIHEAFLSLIAEPRQ